MLRRLRSTFPILIVLAALGCGGGSSSTSAISPPANFVLAGKFLYVANSADATVSGFSISPSGVLTPVPGSNAATSLSSPTGIAVHSAGKVYLGGADSRHVVTFSVDGKTGQLSNPVPLPFDLLRLPSWANPASLVTCGKYLFAFGEGFGPSLTGTKSTGWSGFAYNLNPDGTFDTNEFSGFGVFDSPPIVSNGFIDPTCTYIFHANTAANTAVQTTVEMGAHFSRTTGYPGTPAGTAPVWVAADPDTKFLYVANSASNNVSGFSIDVDSGRLTEVVGSPFPAGAQPASVIVVTNWVYVANATDNTVSAFTRNQATGELTPVAGSPFQVGSMPVAFVTATTNVSNAASGMLLYVANQNSNNVNAFTIESGGVLRPVTGSPFAAGSAPKAMAVLAAQ